MSRFVVKADQLIAAERKRSICLAGLVTKLDFIDTRREALDNCANLATQQAFLWNIFQQSHHRKHFNFSQVEPNPIVQNKSSTAETFPGAE